MEVYDRLLRINAVVAITGVSKSTLARMEKAGCFPKRLQISSKAVGWRESEVMNWLRGLISCY
jgi:prophage regulatory protein